MNESQIMDLQVFAKANLSGDDIGDFIVWIYYKEVAKKAGDHNWANLLEEFKQEKDLKDPTKKK